MAFEPTKESSAEAESTLGDVRLGPFRVIEPIGSGGMAEVWLGRHEEDKVPVAIKFVTGLEVNRAGFLEDFQSEVRAVAMMTHPAITRVFEYGIIEADASSSPFLQKRAGLPYLVMEYASLGTFNDVALPLGWGLLRTVLHVVLEALAHAHARKVVHRDIKPANILLHGVAGAASLIRLTDFGLARSFESLEGAQGSAHLISGTPRYMAPEQFHGRWRDFGPWTDLYALGCVAHELATGKPPFEGANLVMLFMAHQTHPFPQIESAAYPAAFNRWLGKMTAKQPEDRFQCAADAAWHLARIPGPPESLNALVVEQTWRRSGESQNKTLIDSGSIETLILEAGEAFGPAFELAPDAGARPVEGWAFAPLATSWRSGPARKVSSGWLSKTGLGLYGLRAIPLVGREAERDRLWHALCEVARSGKPRLVVVEGPSGAGKSRLARWLVERAEELGAARTCTALHWATPSPQAGFVPMINRHLNTEGLGREAVQQRLGELFAHDPIKAYELGALATVLAADSQDTRAQGADLSERASLIERLLARLAVRPLVVWLDDLQWGLSSLEMIEHLLEATSERALPVLLVATVRDEAVAVRLEEARLLDRLANHAKAERLVLGPLDANDHRELVEGLLGLEPELAAAIVERTAGNPFFAVQLVGDWVERGLLEPGPRGYAVREGEDLVLPEDIHRLWAQRYQSLVARHPVDCTLALEVAAVMGHEIVRAEWLTACRNAKGLPSEALMRDLFESRFIVGTTERWSFVHAMLRETIEQSAVQAGRAPAHHLGVASMLLAHHRPGQADIDERLATHLFAAGQYDDAASLFLAATQHAERRCEYTRTLYLSRRGLEALKRAQIGEEDARYGELGVLRASVFTAIVAPTERRHELEALRARLALPGWSGVGAHCLEFEARALRKNGELIACEQLFERGRRTYQKLGDEDGLARCLEGKAWSLVLRGELEEAEELYALVLARSAHIGEQRVVADCLNGVVEIWRRRGQISQAVAVLEQDKQLCAAIGYSRGMLDCLNCLGDIRREQGELEAAEALYEESLEMGHSMGIKRGVGELNLALLKIERGNFVQAQPVLEELLDLLSGLDSGAVLPTIHAALCACEGARAQWPAAMDHLRAYRERLGHPPIFEPDVALCLEIAAELALDQHQEAEARALLALALDQWRGLSSTSKVRLIEQRLDALGG